MNKPNFFRIKLIITLYLFFTGCSMSNETKYSNDLAELRKIVEIDTDVREIRWEIFGTPEFAGGVPGPTDFITLIAETNDFQALDFDKRGKSGEFWIAPEAARSWLTGDFRTLLNKYRNTSIGLSNYPDCRTVTGKMKKTGKIVSGFTCKGSTTALIYITLEEPSNQ